MLTKEQLQEMNINMVCEGEPVDRDFTGYNKVHFYQMRALSHVPDIYISDLMAYAIAETLSFYKNTQLRADRDEIEETLTHYKNLLKEKTREFDEDKSLFKYADTDYRREHGIKDAIHIVAFDNREVTVNYTGYVPEVRDWMRKVIGAHWQRSGEQWNLVLPWNIVPDFLDFMSDKGNFGYESDELRDMCEHLEDFIEVGKNVQVDVAFAEMSPMQRLTLFPYIKKNEMELPVISFSVNAPAIRDLVFQNKDCFDFRRIAYKDTDKVYCVAGIKGLGRLAELSAESYDFNVSSDIFSYEKDMQEAERKAKSGEYSLCDITKMKLPFTPYPFQLEDAQRALSTKRHLLAHDMGLGKTFISVLIGTSIPKPKLVVVPESLRLNWRREIRNVTPDADVVNLYSNKPFEVGKDWAICGYATAVKFKEELLKAKIPVMFIDEAHLCKAVDNYGKPTSQRASAVIALADNAEYVYPLTGTPIPTSNKDAYNILRLLKSDYLKDNSFFNYGMDFCAGYNNGYGYDFTGNSNAEGLRELLAGTSTRRLKTEVLPDLTKQRVCVPIEAKSAKCDKIIAEMKKCNPDNFLGYAQTVRRLLSGIKIKAALDLADSITAGGEQVVIVTEFRDTIDKIEATYKDKCCTIEGGMSDKAKQQAIDDFQSGKKTVCALNLQAGGVGITLTAAHHMIICDYDWTPANMSQVEDRICRAGQTEPCMIHYIYAEDIDMDNLFVEMITAKSQNSDYIVDGNEEGSINLVTALKRKYQQEKLELEPER